uniref:DEUBAD domain-containing protein n=1 Tax=Anopheles coluzzii TaxID=1518534 RepID=A0A9I3BDE4_ANOCL|nr:uncharacterized protein LOC120955428 isoform X2 [Anopheles coluzzii]
MGRRFVMDKKSSTETMVKIYKATENVYASSSGSDSDESNASLLERSSLLSNKFMLPKDLSENGNIFNEFFSYSLWDALPNATQQKLTKYLPVAKDDFSSTTKIVHSLFSRELNRFYKEPMESFRLNLSTGNYRVDIARLQQNLAKSTTKDRRMVELQRLSRLAQNVMISREAALFSELQFISNHALPSCGRVMDNYRKRRQREYDFEAPSVMAKCQAVATKRYLSEIVSISEEAGLSLSLSDEEECLQALPTAPIRKQRRILGYNVQSGEQSCHLNRTIGHPNLSGASGFTNILSKKSALVNTSNGMGGNTFDGTIFNAPKLFIVTEDHYRKLLVQHRKRKMEEPNHPELNLDGVKLKDVVSRTQIAAGYRRILPLPKVYISDSAKENPIGIKARIKSQKLFRMHRVSPDQADLKHSVGLNLEERGINITEIKVEPSVDADQKSKSVLPNDSSESNSTDNELHHLALKHDEFIEGTRAASNHDKTKENGEDPINTVEKLKPFSEHVLDETELSIKPTAVTSLNPNVLNSVAQSDVPKKASDTSTGDNNSMNLLLSNGTHACFLSVVRDLFCSNPDHRCTMSELMQKLEAWTKSPVAERNDWFEQYNKNGDWDSTLQSAVKFLTGEFQNQPEDFVPYIEHKIAINILQWIGASRDADSRLVPLCTYWQNRKQEMNKQTNMPTITANNIIGLNNTLPIDTNMHVTVSPKNKNKTNIGTKSLASSAYSSTSSSILLPSAGEVSIGFNESSVSSLSSMTILADEDGSASERSVTPPPPLFPTDWSVRKATDEEIQRFREQEKCRYENPHMAFTYKQHSYDSVVGPVKGIYTQAPGISKARGHSMLVANRPNFVTILTLVRDATARLPNGEGTRADICELLKSSQYISPTATDQILQTIVSGALDRMHTEHDPCVKYDAKRKIWIYLHRNRTEQEFERLHMQYQGLSKHKKSIVRKSMRQSRESLTTATSKISNLAKQHQIDDNGPSRDNVASVSSAVEILRDNTTEIINVMDSGTDLSAATSVINIPTTIVGNTVTVARSTTSLLKKQVPLTVMDNSIVQQSCVDTRNENRSASNSPSQTDRTKKSINTTMQDHQLLDSGSDTIYKSSSKLYNAVTLITSSGNNVRTIQIPKSSISLSNRPDVASNHSTVTGNEVLTSELSAHNTSPQSPKKIIVSAVVSAAKTMVASTAISPSTDFSLNNCVDNLQKLNTKPILVQSAGTASPIITPSSCSFSKDAIKISSAIGGTIVSIRQVNNTNLGTLGQKNQTFACAQSTSLLSPQLSTQAKRPQISMNSSSIATTSAANAIRTIKGGTIISAAIEKPNYSSSVTPSTSKQSSISAPMLQSNPATTVLSQKMMLSSARAYASSAGESSNVPTVVAIKPTNSTSITTVTETGTNRPIIRPTANLFSTITLTKGQQSVLTPAKQQQIIQNLLLQNQKQSIITKQIVCTTDDAKQGVGVGSPFQLESPTAVPASFKMQHNSTSSVKPLSQQIVKITPTRAKTHCISTIRPVSTIVTSSNSPGHPSSSIVNQTSPGVKMIKMHPSTMLTSIEPQGMLNASTLCGANTVTISGTNNIGSPASTPNSTMRVLKTATGTTTVIKTEVTPSGLSEKLLSQGTRHHVLDKHRNDLTAHVGSKVIVTPSISTGQLIPLESLLQKQGVTPTTNSSTGGLNTFLKITGTNKTGQQQFLQFTTSSNAASSITSTSASNVLSNSGTTSLGSVRQQYTILPQSRNIISVASTSRTSRKNNIPLTIVSSQDSNESLPSAASLIVGNKKGNVTEVNTIDDTVPSPPVHSPSEKQIPQVKLLTTAQSPKSFSSGAITSTTTIQPQNNISKTKTSLDNTDLLNAKIIGVRNIASTKLKGTSSLSLMNTGGLNIAHIGGKPVIIANNAAIGTNQGITVSTSHLHNNGVNKGTPAGTMLLTSNTNSISPALEQQNSNDMNVPGLPSTARRENACTNSVIPGQIQTLMIRNNLLKVQSVPPTALNKLSQHTTISAGSVGASGAGSGVKTSTTPITVCAGRCTTAQSRQQQQTQEAQTQYPQQTPQKQHQSKQLGSAGSAILFTPHVAANNKPLGAMSMEDKSFVKIQSSSTEISNNADGGSQKVQSQRIVLSQPTIASDLNVAGNALNFKRLKVIPISKQSKQ